MELEKLPIGQGVQTPVSMYSPARHMIVGEEVGTWEGEVGPTDGSAEGCGTGCIVGSGQRRFWKALQVTLPTEHEDEPQQASDPTSQSAHTPCMSALYVEAHV